MAEQPPPPPGNKPAESEADTTAPEGKETPSEPETEHVGLFARWRKARKSDSTPWDDPATPKLELLVKKEKTRSNEYKLAWMAQAGALFIAVVAALSGWYTANNNQDQESNREKAKFTSAQQKEAYAGFINSATDLNTAIELEVHKIANQYPDHPLMVDVLEGKADVGSSYTDLQHSRNLALLFGSQKLRDAANNVLEAANESRSIIIEWKLSGLLPMGPRTPSCPELVDFVNKDFKNQLAFDDAIGHFYDAARVDLAVSSSISVPNTATEPPVDKAICVNFPH